MHSYDVRIWSVRKRPSKAAPFQLRWKVDTTEHQEKFATKTLADARRAELLTATRKGEPFDTETGLPVTEVRERNRTSWYAHARAHAARKWPTAAAKHRASIAESLTIATMALCPAGKGRPADDLLRRALYQWAFNAGRHNQEVPEAEAQALTWVERNAPAVVDLDSARRVRTVLEHLAKRQDGKAAAANTFRRRRAVLSNCLRLAVENELLPGNPLMRVHWETPKAVEELDARSVATPAQARALLDAVRAQGPRGAHLVAFFACIYYAAMRPEEVSMLSEDQCDLPAEGWGRLMLAGARPQVGSAWTDDGKPYEERQLKHRARRAVRPVPIPPVLVAILRAHLDAFGTTAEGRLFSAVRGGPIRSQEYGAAWKEARRTALTAAQVASPLAAIPYDLRHACVSFWLRSGVSLAETARRAGQSVAVLQRYYAKVLDGEEAKMNALIERGLAEHEGQPKGA
ncbi:MULTISPECIES: tyrosine-type recombinase/integrase [unclassified Streptomyces]|uniref:tyrosine-type recombinase/integrase n=1 Tax=unclassified Streptomyces TaxID=2593676 RepID=UPI000DBA4AF8|nr:MULTISPECIES: tyrosine-type recombinase/integrase [unclassified Streptomyces]MYT70268.1 site-specific integrase [Streptomyces sp. SID8367]RAJ88843.1 site-specific recombinase XerD [Streptomyces sp. PsTaAH-137]